MSGNVSIVILNLNWSNGYVSDSARILLKFNEDFRNSVYRDLKQATISIKIRSNLINNPLLCLKLWLKSKESGEIWYCYLVELWNECSKFNPLVDKNTYLKYTSCTIFHLFISITKEDIEKQSYQRIETYNKINDSSYFEFSLSNVLWMTKEIFFQNMKPNNNIIFLGYLCKNSAKILTKSITDPKFKEHMKHKYFKKIIYKETEASDFVSEVLNLKEKEKQEHQEDHQEEEEETSSNLTFDDIYKLSMVKKVEKENDYVHKVDNVDEDNSSPKKNNTNKKKRKISNLFSDDDHDEEERKNEIILEQKLAREQRSNSRSLVSSDVGDDENIANMLAKIEKSFKNRKKANIESVSSPPSSIIHQPEIKLNSSPPSSSSSCKKASSSPPEETTLENKKEEEEKNVSISGSNSSSLSSSSKLLTGTKGENKRVEELVEDSSSSSHCDAVCLFERNKNNIVDDRCNDEYDAKEYLIGKEIRNCFSSPMVEKFTLEQILITYYTKQYLITDPLLRPAIDNVLFSTYQYEIENGFLSNSSNTIIKNYQQMNTKYANKRIRAPNQQQKQLLNNFQLIDIETEDYSSQMILVKEKFEREKEENILSLDDSIRFNVFKTLSVSTWISDDVAHAYVVLLNQREFLLSKVEPLRAKVYFMAPCIFATVVDNIELQYKKQVNIDKQNEHLRNSFENMKLTNFDKMFLYANQDLKHWVLYVVDVNARTINVYDSILPRLSTFSKIQIDKIKFFIKVNVKFLDNKEWEINAHKCNYQKNGCDCGVYMLVFSLFLVDLPFDSCKTIDCVNNARLKIAMDITRGYLEDPRLNHRFSTEDYKKIVDEIDPSHSEKKKTQLIENLIEDGHEETIKNLKQLLSQKDNYIQSLLDEINNQLNEIEILKQEKQLKQEKEQEEKLLLEQQPSKNEVVVAGGGEVLGAGEEVIEAAGEVVAASGGEKQVIGAATGGGEVIGAAGEVVAAGGGEKQQEEADEKIAENNNSAVVKDKNKKKNPKKSKKFN